LTPEYIASKLALLPQFKVISIDHESEEQGLDILLTGEFSNPIASDELGATLFSLDLRTIYGTILAEINGETHRRFQQRQYWPTDISLDELTNGSLTYFGAYDERHLRLALDPEIVWTKIHYAPRPALQSRVIGTDGKPLRKLTEYIEGELVPEGSTVIDGGWDHEHCIFCSKKINSGNVGYHSAMENKWACTWCYQNAVEPHDPRPLVIPYKDRIF